MTIDQIKQAMKYADGYTLAYYEFLELPVVEWGNEVLDIDDFMNDDLRYHPLFLQRVIEGINKFNIEYRIEQCYNMVEVLDSEEYDVIINYLIEDNPDQAKEQAIIWVLEHEDD
jgi:hypothetical protein